VSEETGAEVAAPDLGAADEFVGALSDSERAKYLAKLLQGEGTLDPSEWRYLFALQRAADSIRGALGEVRESLGEVNATLARVSAEQVKREEHEARIIAPITSLTEALVAMTRAQHVAAASEEIIADANDTFRGFAAAGGKVLRGAASERRVLLWVICALSGLSLVLMIVMFTRR